jgi:hypothetical protein
LTFSFSCSSSMRASKQPAKPPYWIRPSSSTPPAPVMANFPRRPLPDWGTTLCIRMAVELRHPPELEVDALQRAGELTGAPVELLLEEEQHPSEADAALGEVLGAQRVPLVGGQLEVHPGLEGKLGRDRGEDGDGDRHHQERDPSLVRFGRRIRTSGSPC